MKHYTHLFFSLLLTSCCFQQPAYAQTVFPHDTRSDSISIEHYTIHLDTRDFTTFILKGHTEVIFEPLVNGITEIQLDLLGLAVDSIQDPNGLPLTFTSNASGFTVDLGTTFGTGDSTSIHVYYHGSPVSDPTFGGYYYTSQFAYNVGISLDDIPHNYGKTWFPCFDNFTTRSTYDLYIRTLPNHDAACGGVFQGTVINGDLSETHHWRVNQTIPSYLASAAVANYVFVEDAFTNYQNDPVPVRLAARAGDTTNMKNSFINLESAFDIFEEKWGPYHWDRVGYVLVPMTAGAMEHAMNIAYPIAAADGGLGWQSVMAHELSHHWWGNLVTCRTAEDMWINEGSAAYCEHVFTEGFNGRSAYEADVRAAHKSLLRTAHIDDEDYWPLSGVPQEHTYGVTTYTKGADMIHTLRGYLGDSLFFNGLSALLDQNQFSDIDAIEYRDELSAITGVDLTNFFADWIFQGGWPHVSIDSLTFAPNGPDYDVTVHLKQKLVGRTNYATGIPLLLTLRDQNWNTFEQKILSSGQTNAVTVTVPFLPVLGYLNRDELISHAVTANYKTITTSGTANLSHANLILQVQTVTDSVWMVVEHHWAAPDVFFDGLNDYTISPQRFWRVDGIWNAGFTTNASFRYSGQLSGTSGYLDHLLITGPEDSIVLLYRPDRSVPWQEFPTYTLSIGSPNDRTGNLNATNLLKGEYTIGLKGQHLGLEDKTGSKDVLIYPNPADGQVTVKSAVPVDRLVVTGADGRIVAQKAVTGPTNELDTKSWPKGTYWITGYDQENQVFHGALVVR
jgi:aminopeptidase N